MSSSPLLMALGVAVLWSIPSIAQTLLLRRLPLHLLMTLSSAFYFVFTTLFMLPRWSFQGRTEKRLLGEHSQWILLALASALLGGFLPNYMFTTLLQSHSAYWVTAITYCSPLFTTLLAMLVLKERPTRMHWTGMLLVILGIVCLSMGGSSAEVGATPVGYAAKNPPSSHPHLNMQGGTSK